MNKLQAGKETHLKVIRSREFRSNLAHELDLEAYRDAELSEWALRSPAEVLAHIMEVLELCYVPACGTYWRPSSAVAKVSGDSILFNRRHLGGFDLVDVGSTILHERGHIQMGFEHDFWATARRPDSLCYLLNRVFEMTAVELGLRKAKPESKKVSIWDRLKFWRHL